MKEEKDNTDVKKKKSHASDLKPKMIMMTLIPIRILVLSNMTSIMQMNMRIKV